jgi:hypothetical protein
MSNNKSAWFIPNPNYAGPPIELTCGRHTKDGRFIPKNAKLSPGIARLSRQPRRRIPMIGDPSQDARAIYEMHMREKRKATRIASATDTLIGRRVTFDPCQCGNRCALIGPGKGPHQGELRCQGCGKHRKWISHESYAEVGRFFAEIVDQFGCVPDDVTFRCPTAPQAEAPQRQPRARRDVEGRARFFPRQGKAESNDGTPFDDPVELCP